MISFAEYTKIVEAMCSWGVAYAAGNNIVEDDVWNANLALIKEFEAANPSFILDTSPTRHVEDGADGFKKVKHEIPMISIENSNGIQETREWATVMMVENQVQRMELEYKLDGLSLALKYFDGILVDAVTRGKDNIGDSVFENAIRVKGVLKTIPLKGEVEIRGETVWKYADFDPVNDQFASEGKKTFANPRNGAAGTLKLHDPDEVERRGLSFVAYLIVKGSPNINQTADIEHLAAMGFEIPEHHVVSTVDELVEVAEDMRMRRFDQEYTIDGVVLKVDDKTDQPRFGYGTKAPNFYRAYKFPPEEKETKLLDIIPSLGMSGSITPVAVLEPVHLAMTTVRNVTLHNWDVVDYLGLYRGCTVVMRKAGEIIPELVKCVETGRSKDAYSVERELCDKRHISHVLPWKPSDSSEQDRPIFLRPMACPCCGGRLTNRINANGEELLDWVCTNEDCSAQIGGKLANFVSRQCMNIMGIGESLVQQLMDAGKLKSFIDLYRLTEQDFMDACGKKEASARKLVQSIEKSRGNYLHQLIEGFSIKEIGHQASPVIAECVNGSGGFERLVSGCPDLVEAFFDDFRRIAAGKGVSELLVDNFIKFASTHVDELREFMVEEIAMKVKPVESMKLAGKVCIMTGTFDKLDRNVFKDMVEANGGKICSSITKKCNLVLIGDGAGPSKLKTIEQYRAAGQQIDTYTPETLDKFLELFK